MSGWKGEPISGLYLYIPQNVSIVAIVVPVESVESVESVDRWYLRKPQIFKECPVLCAH